MRAPLPTRSPIPHRAPSTRAEPNVRLHIDHLVLRGLPFDQQQSLRLESALVAELTRRLHANPRLAAQLAAHSGNTHLPGVTLPDGASPEAAARAFAQALLTPPQPFPFTQGKGTP